MVCGTGDSNIPLPGDPSNDSVISAATILGGLYISWTMPSINPHAVSHFEIHRSTLNNVSSASLYRTEGGNGVIDPIGNEVTGKTYYYWVSAISIHGTVGPLMGPTTGQVTNLTDQLVSHLVNNVPTSALSPELLNTLSGIASVSGGLVQEISNRVNNEASTATLLEGLTTSINEVSVLIDDEITVRGNAVSDLVNQFNAAILDIDETVLEHATAAAASATLAQTSESVATVKAGESAASATAADSSAAASEVGRVASAASATDSDNFSIASSGFRDQSETFSNASSASALAASGHEQVASTAAGTATVKATEAATSESNALGHSQSAAQSLIDVQVFEAGFNADIAAIQLDLSAVITESGGLSAQWQVKSNVNGLEAGVGLFNDGTKTAFGVRADRFYVLNSDTGGEVNPFVIDNNIVYLDSAYIKFLNADIIAGDVNTLAPFNVVNSPAVAISTVGLTAVFEATLPAATHPQGHKPSVTMCLALGCTNDMQLSIALDMHEQKPSETQAIGLVTFAGASIIGKFLHVTGNATALSSPGSVIRNLSVTKTADISFAVYDSATDVSIIYYVGDTFAVADDLEILAATGWVTVFEGEQYVQPDGQVLSVMGSTSAYNTNETLVRLRLSQTGGAGTVKAISGMFTGSR